MRKIVPGDTGNFSQHELFYFDLAMDEKMIRI
jgi:hypothetical protein